MVTKYTETVEKFKLKLFFIYKKNSFIEQLQIDNLKEYAWLSLNYIP